MKRPSDARARLGIDPQILFCDIGMPGMTGHEVVRRLRASAIAGSRRPLLVAITGWGNETDRQHGPDAGFALHLTKPVDAERLGAIIAAAAADGDAGRASGSLAGAP